MVLFFLWNSGFLLWFVFVVASPMQGVLFVVYNYEEYRGGYAASPLYNTPAAKGVVPKKKGLRDNPSFFSFTPPWKPPKSWFGGWGSEDCTVVGALFLWGIKRKVYMVSILFSLLHTLSKNLQSGGFL